MNQANHTSSSHRTNILQANRQAYDRMASRGDSLCQPAKAEELANPLQTVDAAGWLGPSIEGKRVLCLAAGGGRQSALYAAAGAEVTVVDLSAAMLEIDRRVSEELGFSIRLIETSMDQLTGLHEGEFDLVIHPVSTCYLPDVQTVFAEVARVLRPGGLYISQHKSPISLQTSADRVTSNRYEIQHTYYRDQSVPLPTRSSANTKRLREDGAVEFLHRWEELIGGMCRAGFVIEDLIEPVHSKPKAERNSFADRANYVAPYVRIKARRREESPKPPSQSPLWLPNG